jgi:hypothetical protein
MSNVIELNIADIDTVVGGVSASQAAALQMSIPSKTMMAVPNVSAYSTSISRPAVPTYNAADLQARLDALR